MKKDIKLEKLREEYPDATDEFLEGMLEFLDDGKKVNKVTIKAGTDKDGDPEGFETLDIVPGEIVSIVGPTGSGKSRLLADIEWMAQKDTPTNRQVLINGEVPKYEYRFSTQDKLIAQLSQNMNFVMDLSVSEFLNLHAECRMVEDKDKDDVIKKVLEKANNLAGEKFREDTPVTSLSGGQSRALMIADTAIISKSPIVLIDEIENAGIDRSKALETLVGEDKIVLMATHDPLLALAGDRRIIIENGAISKVIKTSDKERELLKELYKLDDSIQQYRSKLRSGEILA
jgi:ABC-type lipoprotein export system ATPase subunit